MPCMPDLVNCKFDHNVINLRLGVIHVGAPFQPRFNGNYVSATSSRGWKATPTLKIVFFFLSFYTESYFCSVKQVISGGAPIRK